MDRMAYCDEMERRLADLRHELEIRLSLSSPSDLTTALQRGAVRQKVVAAHDAAEQALAAVKSLRKDGGQEWRTARDAIDLRWEALLELQSKFE